MAQLGWYFHNHLMSRSGIEPMSIELHLQQGTFFRTLYRTHTARYREDFFLPSDTVTGNQSHIIRVAQSTSNLSRILYWLSYRGRGFRLIVKEGQVLRHEHRSMLARSSSIKISYPSSRDKLPSYSIEVYKPHTFNFPQSRAVVVAQLVERSLPKPEIRGLNPDVGKVLSTNCN